MPVPASLSDKFFGGNARWTGNRVILAGAERLPAGRRESANYLSFTVHNL